MPDEMPQFEWLIIALVYNHAYVDELHVKNFGSNDGYITMEAQKNHLFHAFKDIAFNAQVKIVLIENRLSFEELQDGRRSLKEVINVVEKTNDRKLQTVVKNDASATDVLTDGTKASEILGSITSEYQAKRHVLITFGHGSIFGINLVLADFPLPKDKASMLDDGDHTAVAPTPWIVRTIPLDYLQERLSAQLDLYLKNGGEVFHRKPSTPEIFVEVVQEISKRVILTNKEMCSAIKAAMGAVTSTPDKKLDILVMYNCLMQNLFLQYELRDCVDYLVAPLTGICHPGYNYRAIISGLLQSLTDTNQNIANLFIDTIRDTASKYYVRFKSDIEGTWKVCSMRLEKEKFDKIKNNFDRWVAEMNALGRDASFSLYNCFDQTLTSCFNYAKHCLPERNERQIDFLVFLQFFQENISKGFQKSLPSLLPFIKNLIESLLAVEGHAFLGELLIDDTDFYADARFNEPSGFGFLLQKTPYPLGRIESDTFGHQNDYLPSFLDGSGFEDFFSKYTKHNMV